jgi:SAM-dependent methyltransferase
MDAVQWDERYAGNELVWGAAPNRWVEQEVATLTPASVLDLACGEGRNAMWLARQGWQATGVDFSPVAIGKARQLETAQPEAPPIEWLVADATAFARGESFDLVLMAYLQLPSEQRRAATVNAMLSLRRGGTLLVVAHDLANLAEGTGGPQVADVLYTPADVVEDARLAGVELAVERAETVARPVEGADRPALDVLVRIRRAPDD